MNDTYTQPAHEATHEATWPEGTIGTAHAPTHESNRSGVSWPAIIGGSLAATGTLLILWPVASALGFAAVSPWNMGAPNAALGVMAIIWLIVVQWLSSALGGYLTGRLRTKWHGAHTNEVFFRDTVHGFLSWALTAVISALLLAGFISHSASLTAQTTMVAEMHDSNKGGSDTTKGPLTYMTDGLFRNDTATTTANDRDRMEAACILATGLSEKGIEQSDRAYLVHLINARSGIAEDEANRRIDDTVVKEKKAADDFRKAASALSIFTVISMLVGAFVASAAAALGGAHRDEYYETGTLSCCDK